jgi:glyoxylase-like metal-dependent hydrolase (beta-lactamase superfamily II)
VPGERNRFQWIPGEEEMSTSLRVGEYVIDLVDDHPGTPRDASVVYPDVPSSAWAPYRAIAFNKKGQFQAQWRGHLIRRVDGTGPVVLVDTGMGPGPHQHTGKNGELLDSLAALGVSPSDVTAVVTTHCHGDHVGWNVTWEDGKPRATFPFAKYHPALNDWNHYSQPGVSNPAFQKSVVPLKDIGVLHPVSGEYELAPGVTTLPTNGHTPGHQCVKVDSGGQVAIITGDLFHNVAQVSEQHWCPTFDWRTDLSTASRRWLMWRAQMESWTVVSGHLPTGSSMGKIVERGGKPTWEPV